MINNKGHRFDEDSDELWDSDADNVVYRPTEYDGKENATSLPPEYECSEVNVAGPVEKDESHDDDYYSDSEEHHPDTERKASGRKSFFGIDEEGDDFFNNDVDPDPIPKSKPKPVKLDPEDPDYWMDEESDMAHIMPKPKKAWKWWFAGAVGVLLVILGVWIWFFRPFVDGAVKYGYIKSMERRGSFVKTFEGVLIPYRELGDTTPTYFEEIRFSVDGDSLAARMKEMMLECIPVKLEYESYHTPLFWKGAETMIITKADSADVEKILPPEYR